MIWRLFRAAAIGGAAAYLAIILIGAFIAWTPPVFWIGDWGPVTRAGLLAAWIINTATAWAAMCKRAG